LEVDWKRDISTGLATDGKGRDNLTKRRQRARSVVEIMIMMIITTLITLAGYSNSLCSPVRARISATIRVPWFCEGTGLAVVSSATGPTEWLKY